MDQLADTAAQNCLLAEQVGLGLLLEGGLQDACTASADAGSVSQSDVLCLAGVILLHADQRGAALALGVQAADDVAGPLGAIMITSTFLGAVMVLKWMLKPCAKARALPSVM